MELEGQKGKCLEKTQWTSLCDWSEYIQHDQTRFFLNQNNEGVNFVEAGGAASGQSEYNCHYADA